MRPLIKQFVEICSKTLPILEPIYEFGSYQVPGQKGFADLRPLFLGKKYVGADIRDGDGVDVVMDMSSTPIILGSAGTVLSLDTFEHVEYLREAVDEAYRILKLGGFFIISSVMRCPIHDTHDYWRFTPEGFLSLLKPFTFALVDFIGDPKFPHTVVGIASENKVLDDLKDELIKQFATLK